MYITGGFSCWDEFRQNGFSGCKKNVKYHYLVFLLNHNIWLRRINRYFLFLFIKPFLINRIVTIALKDPSAIIWPSCDLIGLKSVIKLKNKKRHVKTFMELSEFLDIHHYNKGSIISKKNEDKIWKLFETNAFFKFDALALMTKTLLQHYQNFPDPKPVLFHLPMTVDFNRFDEKRKEPEGFIKPYLVFVGVMNNAKEGIDILIKAFYKIKDIRKDLKLYLVGPWHYDTPGHLQLINELKMQERIFWMGEYVRDDIPAILQNAELLVLPRPDSKQARGGFPTKLGEYLASGVPVCVTTVGEIPDYLKDGVSAYFAEPGSVSSLADAMRKALINPEEAMQIGINGRKVAKEKFNKEIQAKILYDKLNSIL